MSEHFIWGLNSDNQNYENPIKFFVDEKQRHFLIMILSIQVIIIFYGFFYAAYFSYPYHRRPSICQNPKEEKLSHLDEMAYNDTIPELEMHMLTREKRSHSGGVSNNGCSYEIDELDNTDGIVDDEDPSLFDTSPIIKLIRNKSTRGSKATDDNFASV